MRFKAARTLNRQGLMQCIVRIAIGKYVRSGEVRDVSNAVEQLCRDIACRLPPEVIPCHSASEAHTASVSPLNPTHATCHHTRRHDTTPSHATPHHTTPHHATPHHATPHHTTPRHTTPHHTTQNDTTLSGNSCSGCECSLNFLRRGKE